MGTRAVLSPIVSTLMDTTGVPREVVLSLVGDGADTLEFEFMVAFVAPFACQGTILSCKLCIFSNRPRFCVQNSTCKPPRFTQG